MTDRNREMRRHPERLERGDGALERDVESQKDMATQGNQDVKSTRAKSSGHGKKTADKWNQ
jgi:hypothetical protein